MSFAMKVRLDNWLQRQLGGLIPHRREWLHTSSWKPPQEVEWRWLRRSLVIRWPLAASTRVERNEDE